MTAIAKRLIGAFPAAAERDAISDLISFTVGGFYRDTASDPERAHLISLSIKKQTDRRLQFRLKGFTVFIPGYQPAGRTIPGFFNHNLPGLGVYRAHGELPGSPGAVAKTGGDAVFLSIGQFEVRPVEFVSQFQIGFINGCFGAHELNFGMGTVTKGFIFWISAAAKGITLLDWIFFPFFPAVTLIFCIYAHDLLSQGRSARHQIWAVFRDLDFIFIFLYRLIFWICHALALGSLLELLPVACLYLFLEAGIKLFRLQTGI
jgi:hypothetical protein